MKQLTSYNRVAGYLNKMFDMLNDEFFEGTLSRPTITIQSTPVEGWAEPVLEIHRIPAMEANTPEATFAIIRIRLVLTPDIFAASIFPPVARYLRPRTVYLNTYPARARAITARISR